MPARQPGGLVDKSTKQERTVHIIIIIIIIIFHAGVAIS
jgi:hypothetical protein